MTDKYAISTDALETLSSVPFFLTAPLYRATITNKEPFYAQSYATSGTCP